jgi:hypothetical protein
LAYPNPTPDIVNLKYFEENNQVDINIHLVDNIRNIQPVKNKRKYRNQYNSGKFEG